MGDVVNFIYAFAAACAFALGGLGALIMSLSKRHTRVARGFIIASAFPLFLLPITFGWTYPSRLIGLTVAALSSFALGIIYYVGISVLSDYLKRGRNPPKRLNS